jgi:hypothetical protein
VSNLARRRGRLSLLNLSLNRITGTARFFRALLAGRKQRLQIMSSLKPLMGPTKFVTWTITRADGHPTMTAALEHLASVQ